LGKSEESSVTEDRSLTIGFVFDDTLDRNGGVAQHTTTLGAEFRRRGHRVSYLVGQSSPTDLGGDPVHSLARNVDVSFNGNRLSMPLTSRRRAIRAVLEATNFDVLHVQMPFSPFMAARVIASASPETAVVGSFHIASELLLPRVGARLLRFATARAVARFDAVVAVSDVARRFARESFELAVDEVIPNMIDIEGIRRTAAWEALRSGIDIAFVGRLVRRKGARQLLDAFGLLHRERPTTTLALAGDGPLRAQLERVVRRHDLDGAVRFLGTVSEAEKAALLAGATIACFPSRYGESFGVVLLEGMAAGAQVVVGGRNAGHAELFGSEERVLVDPDDARSFASTLLRLLDNRDMRTSLHAWQQKLVSAYDVEAIAERFLAMYRKAIALRRAGEPKRTTLERALSVR
jgi:phosphatidyl-myo-inositol alpha-mannosyltransferase